MKNKSLPAPAIPLVVVGLMLATVTPILSRQLHMSDVVKGFITGLGIGLELIGLIIAMRHRQKSKARAAEGARHE